MLHLLWEQGCVIFRKLLYSMYFQYSCTSEKFRHTYTRLSFCKVAYTPVHVVGALQKLHFV